MTTCMLAYITLVCCFSCVSPLCPYKELELFNTALTLEGEHHDTDRAQIADQEAERDSALRSAKQTKSKAILDRVTIKEELMYKIKTIQKKKNEDDGAWAVKAGD